MSQQLHQPFEALQRGLSPCSLPSYQCLTRGPPWGKCISTLSLGTTTALVLCCQEKCNLENQAVLTFLFLPELTGGSTCPKVTVVPPCPTSSTTKLIDQNVSEEAQGINGKTPAKHCAPSPKPQGRHPGLVLCCPVQTDEGTQENTAPRWDVKLWKGE